MREQLLAEIKNTQTSAARVEEIFSQAQRELRSSGSILGSWLARSSLSAWRELSLLALKHPSFPPRLMQEVFERDPEYDNAAAIGENPSAPLPLLYQAWAKAPDSFLHNPIVQLLQLESPHFWQELPIVTMQGLIGLPDIGVAIFEFAFKKKNANLLQQIAQHPQAPAEILKRLSVSGEQQVLDKVARNANLPLRALERLLGHPYESVRRAASENRSLPAFWVGLLRKVRESLLQNLKVYPALSDEEFCSLARCGPFLQGYVTKHPLTPPAVLAALATDESRPACQEVRGEIPREWLAQIESVSWRDLTMLEQIAVHPNTPNGTLIELAGHIRFRVREAITKRGSLDEEVQLALISRVGVRARFELGVCTNTQLAVSKRRDLSPQVVEILLRDGSAAVRENLARYAALTREQLEQLLYDKSPQIGLSIVERLGDPSLLRRFAESQHAEVRLAAKRRVNQPEIEPLELTHRYTEEEYEALLSRGPYVRELLTKSALTPQWVQQRLSLSSSALDRRYIAQSQMTPPEILSSLIRDASFIVRAEVAKNPRAPAAALRELAASKQELILQGLAENPKLPAELLASLLIKPSPSVMIRLLQSPALDEKSRQDLFARASSSIIRQLSLDAASPELLRSLLQRSSTLKVKRALASNPNLPPSLVRELQGETDKAIQRALSERSA